MLAPGLLRDTLKIPDYVNADTIAQGGILPTPPPEIRHRVLWAEEGSEVVELGMPAFHETWVEHEITLPTGDVRRDRDFNGPRFIHHIATDFPDSCVRDTGVNAASGGVCDVKVIRSGNEAFVPELFAEERETIFGFVLHGEIRSTSSNRKFSTGESFVEGNKAIGQQYECSAGTECFLPHSDDYFFDGGVLTDSDLEMVFEPDESLT